METRSIEELRQYLDKFKKEMSEISVGHLEEIPKFSIPNWPQEAGVIEVVLIRQTLLCPYYGKESNKLNLRKQFFPIVKISISTQGQISVEIRVIFYRIYDYYSSDSYNLMNRVMCFIIFSQLLDPLCKKIIRKLEKRYSRYRQEVIEYNRVCEAVKKSFEPLIPFVVADILNEEGS